MNLFSDTHTTKQMASMNQDMVIQCLLADIKILKNTDIADDYTKMPEEGQFIIIWEHDNKIWTQTCKWYDGALYSYDYNKCSFTIRETANSWNDIPDKIYLRRDINAR